MSSLENNDKGQSLIRFVKWITTLRRRISILRHGRFLTDANNEELDIKELTGSVLAEQR
jgi:glycogen operon protein